MPRFFTFLNSVFTSFPLLILSLTSIPVIVVFLCFEWSGFFRLSFRWDHFQVSWEEVHEFVEIYNSESTSVDLSYYRIVSKVQPPLISYIILKVLEISLVFIHLHCLACFAYLTQCPLFPYPLCLFHLHIMISAPHLVFTPPFESFFRMAFDSRSHLDRASALVSSKWLPRMHLHSIKFGAFLHLTRIRMRRVSLTTGVLFQKSHFACRIRT